MADNEEVKLLGSWASPFVMRPRIALNIKSVDYEFLEETFGSKSQLLLLSNPVHKKIPVLIHANNPIAESLVIVQYIDEVWTAGPAILPSDPYDRAAARFWAAYIDDKWFPAMRGLLSAKEEEKAALIEQLAEATALLEGAFVKLSKGKRFFGGDRIGYVDIALGCYLGWLRVTQNGFKFIDVAKTPALARWADDFSADAAVRDVMPDLEKLTEFAKVVKAKMEGEIHKNK